MYKEFYAGSDLMNWPLIGLGIFVLTFIGVLLYVFVGLKDSPTIDRLAAMPLALTLVAPLGAQEQQQRPDVESFIPADCYASFRFGGLEQCAEHARKLGLYQLCDKGLNAEAKKAIFSAMEMDPDTARAMLRKGLQKELGIEPPQGN